MFRFYFVITISVFTFFHFYYKYKKIERKPEKYSEDDRYNLVRFACRAVKKRGRIEDTVVGIENLPKDGGYIMYANHQGKYDAVGIMLAHDEPCSIVIDEARSRALLLDQVTTLLRGKRLDKSDPKNQIRVIREVAEEVKAGRKFLIFPEGGYPEGVDSNELHDFMPGSFKAATTNKSPIVPVVLYDSYKVFFKNSLKKVSVQIHFLSPIYYDMYKDMSTVELSEYVKNLISSKLEEIKMLANN